MDVCLNRPKINEKEAGVGPPIQKNNVWKMVKLFKHSLYESLMVIKVYRDKVAHQGGYSQQF